MTAIERSTKNKYQEESVRGEAKEWGREGG